MWVWAFIKYIYFFLLWLAKYSFFKVYFIIFFMWILNERLKFEVLKILVTVKKSRVLLKSKITMDSSNNVLAADENLKIKKKVDSNLLAGSMQACLAIVVSFYENRKQSLIKRYIDRRRNGFEWWVLISFRFLNYLLLLHSFFSAL